MKTDELRDKRKLVEEMETSVRDEPLEWALYAQTLLIFGFLFIFYVKNQNTRHLHTIITGSILAYDFKRYQKKQKKTGLISLVIWFLIFAFSLITSLQKIATL